MPALQNPSASCIPLRGFGTFQADPNVYPPGTAKGALLAALSIGYRHIDTAYAYGNGQIECEVGQAIEESGVPRSELFVVTKLLRLPCDTIPRRGSVNHFSQAQYLS